MHLLKCISTHTHTCRPLDASTIKRRTEIAKKQGRRRGSDPGLSFERRILALGSETTLCEPKLLDFEQKRSPKYS